MAGKENIADTDDSAAVKDVKEALAEQQKQAERDKAASRGSYGINNALRGMKPAESNVGADSNGSTTGGTVSVDETGLVTDDEMTVPEEIDLKLFEYTLHIKLQTINDLIFGTGCGIRSLSQRIDAGIKKGKPEGFLLTIEIDASNDYRGYSDHSLSIVVYSDNTAGVSIDGGAEFDLAPVVQAVGNSPELERLFGDFKRTLRNEIEAIREKVEKQNENIAEALGRNKSKKMKKKLEKSDINNNTSTKETGDNTDD